MDYNGAFFQEGFQIQPHGQRTDTCKGVVVGGIGCQGMAGRHLVRVDQHDILDLKTHVGPSFEKGEVYFAEMIFAKDIIRGQFVDDGSKF